MSKIKHFSDMPVWQETVDATVRIYELTKGFPQSEKYGVTNQLRRAAVSISCNIAEGYGRSSSGDKKRFYDMARGSAFEVQNLLLIGSRLDIIDETESNDLFLKLGSIIHALNKMKISLV